MNAPTGPGDPSDPGDGRAAQSAQWAVDTVLAERARTSADVLAGLIAAGMLQHAVGVDRLPALLWPDTDPERVQEIWDAALAVGFTAGQYRSRRLWETDELDAARDALYAAGYEALAHEVEDAAYAAPSRCRQPDAPVRLVHPADTELPRSHP